VRSAYSVQFGIPADRIEIVNLRHDGEHVMWDGFKVLDG
jgi:hypothetical protein